ncbi:MAG TPA: gas vesicle protein [Pseudonocardiaceae bacterium]|nr:gas vesicle protein [Pseudonocardiaceae bacterium]
MLERVLDKGIVIAGDIVVNVLDIELLSIKLRLFISSAQTAKEMGMDWWSRDPFFTTAADRDQVDTERDGELESLRTRVRELERREPR